MGYLRLVHAAEPDPGGTNSCVEAFDEELDYLFTTLLRLGAGAREIEDLAQEVFVVLHRNWTTLDKTRPLRPYLFGVAFRMVCAHRRRRSREVPYAVLEVEDGSISPEGMAQSKQSTALLMAALEHVPLNRRAVLIMHELDGVPIADVASKLSITRFGAYARLRKARGELGRALRRLSKEGTAE